MNLSRSFKTAFAATLISTLPFAAAAATFDFAQIANQYKYDAGNTGAANNPGNGNTEGTFLQVVAGLGAGVFTDGGVTINNSVAFGSNNPNNTAQPFFDGSGSKTSADQNLDLAGLGVCSSGSIGGSTSWAGGEISDCSSNAGGNAGDDNATGTEQIAIFFDQEVSIVDSFWRDANHNAFTGLVDYATDLLSVGQLTITNGSVTGINGGGGLGGSGFFSFAVNADSTPDKEIYLSVLEVSPVPLPAGLLLMGTALAGFGVMRRRKAS